MSRWLTAFSMLLLLAGCGEQAPQKQPVQQEMTEEQVLKELETHLKHLFEQACPEAEMTTEKRELAVSYHAVLVDMGKGVCTGIGDPIESLRWFPKPDGFVLSVRVGKGDYWRELDFPEETKSGFTCYYVAHKVRWQESIFIDVNLDFGEKTDKKLIEKIKQTIAAYAKDRK